MIGVASRLAVSVGGVRGSVFTQCSKCETVFRLSAEALRAAGGQVRCGRCGEVFNALARLAEDASEFTRGEPSPLDLETRADEILESLVLEQMRDSVGREDGHTAANKAANDGHDAPPGVEMAQLHFLDPIDDDLVAETSLEFTLPPGDLERIFTETRSSPLGSEVAENVRHDMLASNHHAEPPLAKEPRRALRVAMWSTAAFLLSLSLLAQVIRGNQEWLAAHVQPLLMGNATTAAANLSSYQLRQWGVTGDPGAKGTLRVRASIMNTAAQLQRYPLLRVSLVDRFGTRVGKREFEPAEYLGRPVTRMLAPGERVEAALDILDPGKDAEGFEIDVCIRRLDKTIACAGDAASQDK